MGAIIDYQLPLLNNQLSFFLFINYQLSLLNNQLSFILIIHDPNLRTEAGRTRRRGCAPRQTPAGQRLPRPPGAHRYHCQKQHNHRHHHYHHHHH